MAAGLAHYLSRVVRGLIVSIAMVEGSSCDGLCF